MLKGKKKLLAAQVLLGLLVASQAYAAEYTVANKEAAGDTLEGNTCTFGGNGNYRFDNVGQPILGGDKGIWEKNEPAITGNNILISTGMAGCLGHNAALIKANTVTNNTITIGHDYFRSIYDYWSEDHILRNVFNDLDAVTSEGNKLVLGAMVAPDDTNQAILGIDVGAGNDIELMGGIQAGKTADFSNMSFAGRDLTLADKAGTEKIKSAAMKGDITAARALDVTEGISAGKNINVTGGLTAGNGISAGGDISVTGGGLTAGNGISAGGNISGGALKAANISAGGSIDSTGDITADTLLGNGISATGAINIKGAINALNGASKTRAAVAGVLKGNSIDAGSITASSIEATGNITTGNMNVAENVTAGGDITISNGASEVKGTLDARGNLNIKGNSTLTAGTIKLTGSDKLKIESTATGTILSAGSVLDQNDTAIDMSLAVDTSKKTTNTEGLFTKVYGITASEKSVTSGVVSTTLSEKSKSVVETQIASLAGVITSADLLSNAGFSNASQAVQQSNAEGGSAREMVPYAAVGYGNMRQESGSYVDVQGSAFNIGFAKEVKNGSGKLLFGPMIEYGRGSYESYLDDGTKGDGNTQNFGLGVMARQNNDNGTYYEGSLRYGKLTSNYNSGDLGADYDTDANYWGAHFGLGKVFQLNDKNSIDTYCKFFYTNQGSSSANILGSNVEFDAVKSKRSRLGFRFNHATSDVRSIYAGLAWQHEFDGSACATVDGFSAPSPSIKGNSMMVELGVNVAPKSSPVSFDLGVSGWAGKQKGYSLNANMLWSF
ncbi:MAG: autotransporter outer membrane beta-barrel domain-containing protein [Veillonellaceae bacterium]|nr:autotransporter outer membrane beta-barrel domain-containing protein [Veillonellaceae bacterium]